MIQSITFGDKNTWDDWKIVPKERPVFAPPKVKTKYIDIPGGNGSVDLSESLTGYPVYENRTGSFKFYVMNGYADWQDRYSEIMNYLHGQRMKAVLADDPDWYYYGRFSVDSWEAGDTWSEIAIGYEVEPFKWAKSWTTSYTTTINYSSAMSQSLTDDEFYLEGNAAPVYPTVTVSEDVYISFYLYSGGDGDDIKSTVLFSAGTTEYPDFMIYGEKEFEISLQGPCNSGVTVSIEIPIGRL